jgi:hypothetical protein
MYVAITRARKHLVLSWPGSAEPESAPPRASTPQTAPKPVSLKRSRFVQGIESAVGTGTVSAGAMCASVLRPPTQPPAVSLAPGGSTRHGFVPGTASHCDGGFGDFGRGCCSGIEGSGMGLTRQLGGDFGGASGFGSCNAACNGGLVRPSQIPSHVCYAATLQTDSTRQGAPWGGSSGGNTITSQSMVGHKQFGQQTPNSSAPEQQGNHNGKRKMNFF